MFTYRSLSDCYQHRYSMSLQYRLLPILCLFYDSTGVFGPGICIKCFPMRYMSMLGFILVLWYTNSTLPSYMYIAVHTYRTFSDIWQGGGVWLWNKIFYLVLYLERASTIAEPPSYPASTKEGSVLNRKNTASIHWEQQQALEAMDNMLQVWAKLFLQATIYTTISMFHIQPHMLPLHTCKQCMHKAHQYHIGMPCRNACTYIHVLYLYKPACIINQS